MRYWWLWLLAAAGFASASACAATWSGIRDGALYLRSLGPTNWSTEVAWREAWMADAQYERLYWTGPDGELLNAFDITPEQTRGGATLPGTIPLSTYRLDIPGYSFRRYSVTIPAGVQSLFSPAPVHFSIEVKAGLKLYLHAPAGAPFTLNGKYHGGVRALTLRDVQSEQQFSLTLARMHAGYANFDSASISQASRERTFLLEFEGRGKVAFWVDGIPNLFALDPQDLFPVALRDGRVRVQVMSEPATPTTKLGAALEYSLPPDEVRGLLRSLSLRSANHYFYEDRLSRDGEEDIPFLEYTENGLGITDYVAVRANTGRRPLITDARQTSEFLHQYLLSHRGKHGLALPFVALVDEPNLNYPSYERFEHDFIAAASAIKSSSSPKVSATQIVAPYSSRFLNGPTRSESRERSGALWLSNLLSRRSDLVDAIAWNNWLVRDLIATDQFRLDIAKARDLDRAHPHPAGDRPLLIAQTNISSGAHLSPYEQDTFFAGLWLASVFINTAATGEVRQLNWFKIADDGTWNKGLLREAGASFHFKPVAHAMQFLNDHWRPETTPVTVEPKTREVEFLALRADDGSLAILGVNKLARAYDVQIRLPKSTPISSANARLVHTDATLRPQTCQVAVVQTDGLPSINFTAAARTIFVVQPDFDAPTTFQEQSSSVGNPVSTRPCP